ncbi:MAG: hypothetical protein AVDCRST_MAG20-906 [uncultured Acidimicrobiales bacterium]|uniref:Uncharacterized protein n=1 Tax=uncultured Acidimicrobiales bacterium TaxID=310071 RepID=A0A6J4HLP7_9ACTN|nr:MAG: hypothetical protein AVDCRST_MAG20-906 [uncultured Acidimicrobiales bacterium]
MRAHDAWSGRGPSTGIAVDPRRAQQAGLSVGAGRPRKKPWPRRWRLGRYGL